MSDSSTSIVQFLFGATIGAATALLITRILSTDAPQRVDVKLNIYEPEQHDHGRDDGDIVWLERERRPYSCAAHDASVRGARILLRRHRRSDNSGMTSVA
jgi:hypothetical protein